jgi:hypothetical protein
VWLGDDGYCIAFCKPGIRDTSDRLLGFSHRCHAKTLPQRKVVAIVNDLKIDVEWLVVAGRCMMRSAERDPLLPSDPLRVLQPVPNWNGRSRDHSATLCCRSRFGAIECFGQGRVSPPLFCRSAHDHLIDSFESQGPRVDMQTKLSSKIISHPDKASLCTSILLR